MQLCNDKEDLYGQSINNRGIGLPIILSPLLHTAVSAYPSLVLVETAVRESLALERPNRLDELGLQREG